MKMIQVSLGERLLKELLPHIHSVVLMFFFFLPHGYPDTPFESSKNQLWVLAWNPNFVLGWLF